MSADAYASRLAGIAERWYAVMDRRVCFAATPDVRATLLHGMRQSQATLGDARVWDTYEEACRATG